MASSGLALVLRGNTRANLTGDRPNCTGLTRNPRAVPCASLRSGGSFYELSHALADAGHSPGSWTREQPIAGSLAGIDLVHANYCAAWVISSLNGRDEHPNREPDYVAVPFRIWIVRAEPFRQELHGARAVPGYSRETSRSERFTSRMSRSLVENKSRVFSGCLHADHPSCLRS